MKRMCASGLLVTKMRSLCPCVSSSDRNSTAQHLLTSTSGEHSSRASSMMGSAGPSGQEESGRRMSPSNCEAKPADGVPSLSSRKHVIECALVYWELNAASWDANVGKTRVALFRSGRVAREEKGSSEDPFATCPFSDSRRYGRLSVPANPLSQNMCSRPSSMLVAQS